MYRYSAREAIAVLWEKGLQHHFHQLWQLAWKFANDCRANGTEGRPRRCPLKDPLWPVGQGPINGLQRARLFWPQWIPWTDLIYIDNDADGPPWIDAVAHHLRERTTYKA